MSTDTLVYTSQAESGLPPLRLAIVSHRFQKNDGQGRVNYEVARAALDHGIRLTLVAEHCAEDLAAHPNIRVVRVNLDSAPTQLGRNLVFAFRSARWLRAHREEFDLIQANGFVTWEACDIVAAHFVHSSWIKSLHYPFKRSMKPYDLYQLSYTWLNSKWERKAFGSARRVIAVSEVVADDVTSLGMPADRTEVIYNGVDTMEFCPGPAERASFGLPENVPMAVFVGDIRTPRKNLGTLLEALVHTPGLHLAVAGKTEGSPAPEQARRLGLEGRVHFLGMTKRIPALMRSVDLFCFPSRYEAHPLVVLEAMASGLPVVISSNVGSVKSFGKNFLVIQDPDDPLEIALILRGLLADPDRRARLSAAVREQALALSWSETVAAYLRTYSELRRRP
jgi:glycosyltransferase involved in cell wall biosynthesis